MLWLKFSMSMRSNYRGACSESQGKAIVQQDYKPFHMILEDYLNGNVALPQTEKGSFQFDQEGDVDFSAEGLNNHHDIYDVASGADPVFPDAKAVDAPSPASPSASSPESPAPSE